MDAGLGTVASQRPIPLRFSATQAFKAGFGAPSTTIITPAGGTTLVVAKSNNEKIRDDHWLVDFAVGRDFGLGNSNAQWKIGFVSPIFVPS